MSSEKVSGEQEKHVDTFRATRQFERFFGGRDVFGLRDVRTSWERVTQPDPVDDVHWPLKEARLIATVTYNLDTGEVTYKRAADGQQPETDIESTT